MAKGAKTVMRRVVVTGLGLVTPLASGVEESWSRLLAGQSGAGPIKQFDAVASGVTTTYACEVPLGDGSDGTFNADDWLAPKEQRKIDDFILFGIAAADMACHDAGWTPEDEADRLRSLVDRMLGPNKALQMAPTNIHEVLERVRTLIEAESRGKVHLKRDYDPSIPPLLADSSQLIQAMLNIVRNAMQALFSPKVDHNLGRIYLRTRIIRNATIGAKFHRLVASIRIVDNGPGIKADMLDSIFAKRFKID